MIEFTDIQITIVTLLTICGGITLVAGAAKAAAPLLHPFKKIVDRLSAVEKKLEQHDRYLDNDKAELATLKAMQKENTKVNLALLNHFIDGNGKEKMKELRDDIQEKYIEVI